MVSGDPSRIFFLIKNLTNMLFLKKNILKIVNLTVLKSAVSFALSDSVAFSSSDRFPGVWLSFVYIDFE